jgi:hypothetical protein
LSARRPLKNAVFGFLPEHHAEIAEERGGFKRVASGRWPVVSKNSNSEPRTRNGPANGERRTLNDKGHLNRLTHGGTGSVPSHFFRPIFPSAKRKKEKESDGAKAVPPFADPVRGSRFGVRAAVPRSFVVGIAKDSSRRTRPYADPPIRRHAMEGTGAQAWIKHWSTAAIRLASPLRS